MDFSLRLRGQSLQRSSHSRLSPTTSLLSPLLIRRTLSPFCPPLLGIETIAHLRQPANAKLTIMFVALSGGPRIVRLFGKGRVYERSTREFEQVRVCVRLEGLVRVWGMVRLMRRVWGEIDLAGGGREDPAWLSSDHRVGRSIRRDCKRRSHVPPTPSFTCL